MNISGRLIDAFLALEETRRFASAAERCHVTPSAFSQMISRLEHLVGTRLFDRTTRHVALTPEGEVFAAGVRRVAAEMQATMLELQDRVQQRTGRIRLAAIPSAAAQWLPQQLAVFHERHPRIELHLWDRDSDRCIEMVGNSEADFAILNAQPEPARVYEAVHLFDEPFMVLCPNDDPLVRLGTVKLEDLIGRRNIPLVAPGSTWRQSQGIAKRAGMIDSGLAVSHFGSLSGLVASRFGLGLIPACAELMCRRPGIVALPICTPDVIRSVFLLKLRDRSLPIPAAALWNQVLDAQAAGTLF